MSDVGAAVDLTEVLLFLPSRHLFFLNIYCCLTYVQTNVLASVHTRVSGSHPAHTSNDAERETNDAKGDNIYIQHWEETYFLQCCCDLLRGTRLFMVLHTYVYVCVRCIYLDVS